MQTLFRFLICVIFLSSYRSSLFAQVPPKEQPRKPNIVWIVTDDLGINDLSCYGRKDQQTPNLDGLARDGLRFTSAYCAQPICSASRAAMMTGKHPARLHLTTYLPGRPDAPSQKLLHPRINMQLPVEEITVAEVLTKAGYKTACIGKWHLGGKGFQPTDQGFQMAYAGTANTNPSAVEGGKGEYDLTNQAEAFIAANQDRPFFLYLSHNTPHIRLAAKPELVEKYSKSFNPIYAAMIETMDDCVGRVLRKLDACKLAQNTLVIFTSDNGGLHVLESPNTPATHNTPFRAGKGFLYEGGLRVPTILRWPGKIKPAVSDVPIVNTDIPVTLMALAGSDIPKGLDGMSLLDFLTGKAELSARSLFWHFPHYTNQGSRPAGAIREGNWKLIENYEDGSLELYDLASDPSEKKNLVAAHAERARNLLGKLVAWRKDAVVQTNQPNPEYQPALGQPIYRDFDPSNVPLKATAAEMAKEFTQWRQRMDEAIRKKK